VIRSTIIEMMEGHRMAKHEQPDKGWREWVLKSLPIQNMTQTAGFEPGPANPEPFSAPMSSLVPSYDVIERLPPGGADHLRALRLRFRETNLLIPKHDVMHPASTARIMAEQRLKRLRDHQSNGGFNLPETDSRVVEQQRLLDKVTDDLRRLNELVETRSAVWHAASHVLSAVEGWLKNGVPPGVLLEDIEVEVPKLAKNEPGLLDAIENRRRRVRELKADAHRIQSAPFLSAHARAKIREEVEALAARGRPVVTDVIEHDGSVIWPMLRLQGSIINAQAPSFVVTQVPDLLGLFACVHGPALLKVLDGFVDDEKDDAAALSHTDREKRLSEVQQDQLAAEFDESALVWSAMAQNLPVEHRADCAPQAILQVRLVTAPRVEATGTTPGYSWDLRR
jgi:hypothetical protein